MSTSKVIEWLLYLHVPFVRINDTDIVEIIEVSLYRFIIKVKDKIINSNDIGSFWYRRGKLTPKLTSKEINVSEINNSYESFLSSVIQHEKLELKVLVEYIYYLLKRISINIGSFFTHEVNKLYVLEKAQFCGLQIPMTIVSNNSAAIQEKFLPAVKKITKPLSIPFNFLSEVDIASYTEEIDTTNQTKFQASFIQEMIAKDYEIRIFFLKDKLYSMAIFSQNDDQTKVDFRKYNYSNPNRNVPYKLPLDIEEKIIKLMTLLNLDTASIDMIKDKNGNYIFLEVNPVGQFGMVSYPCNYNIEFEIANMLAKY